MIGKGSCLPIYLYCSTLIVYAIKIARKRAEAEPLSFNKSFYDMLSLQKIFKICFVISLKNHHMVCY